jgi:capsular polysaccharide export protein
MMQGYVASAIADTFQIKKLFFEIGNFPNRIFVDEKGVNARSSLMDRDLSICPDYNQDRLTDLLERHKDSKEQAHIVPQVKALKRINWATLFDHWYNVFHRYPLSEGYPNALKEWWQNRFGKRIEVHLDTVSLQDHDYILFPLQVSIDSQIIRNSDISLIAALELALQEANRQHLDLLIKPHPVEANRKLFDFMAELRSNNSNLYVVSDNTYRLIKHCRKVITINSTVGIESLMYHKHVQVLGRALYKPYCQPDLSQPVDHDRINRFLYNYLFNCLQEGDFYKTGPINIRLS